MNREHETPAYFLSGWLRNAQRVPSPNFDTRPQNCDIRLIVVHNISLPPGRFGGDAIERLFTNRLDPRAHPFFSTLEGLRVSAHFLIRRDGQLIQFVGCDDRAWHAGTSSWRGRARCNDYSIGIELEGVDTRPYTSRQYARLAMLTRRLRHAYPALSGVAGHDEISPGRKTDPGPAFDWSRFILAAGLPGSWRNR